MNSMRNACFLLGAGASVDAGLPTMVRLREDFLNACRDPLLSARLDEFRTLADETQPQQIEGLLGFLNDTTRNSDSPRDRRDAAILAFEIKKHILRYVSRRPTTVNYLDGIQSFLQPAPLDIFTMNYDVVIETWCQQRGLSFTDGFNPQGEWDQSELTTAECSVRLWKLHGSITWQQENDQISRTGRLGTLREELRTSELRSRTFDASIIYPAAQKTATGILNWLQTSFATRLATVDFLITIGYSFGDEHISTKIARALDQNTALHVIIVAPTPDIPAANLQRSSHPDHHHRIHSQQGTGKSILQPGTLQQIIATIPTTTSTRRIWTPPPYNNPSATPARASAPPTPVGTIILSQPVTSIAHAQNTLLYLAREGKTWTLYQLPWPAPNIPQPRAIANGFHDPRGIAITRDGAYVVDATILGRYMGAGGIWHINLTTGEKTMVVGRPRAGKLLPFIRHREHDAATLGMLRWPTSITAYEDDLLVTESRRVTKIDTTTRTITPITERYFLNLNGITHWCDNEVLVFEHVLTTARAPGPGVGTLWSIDLDDQHPPHCITGGFTNARGLAIDRDRSTAYVGEIGADGTWHVVRVNLTNGQRETMIGTYGGKPGFTMTENHDLLLCTPQGIIKRDP